MTKLNKPIEVVVTGDNSSTGSDIVVVGSEPLPFGDAAVTPILLGLNITVKEDCRVYIMSNNVVIYDKDFTGVNYDNVSDIKREGAATHGMKLFVSGCGENNITRAIFDLGFKYNGGAKAI